MKYSDNFLKDARWYLSMRNVFKFSPKNNKSIHYSLDGYDWMQAYFMLDTYGVMHPTRHPLTLKRLLNTKAAINFQIKEWAQGLYDFTSTKFELEQYLQNLKAPEWVIRAVNNQRYKIYFENENNQLHKVQEMMHGNMIKLRAISNRKKLCIFKQIIYEIRKYYYQIKNLFFIKKEVKA